MLCNIILIKSDEDEIEGWIIPRWSFKSTLKSDN